jgi:hypothetical protein
VTQNFHSEFGKPSPPDRRVKINVGELLFNLKRWQTEDQLVHQSFTTYPSYFDSHIDYRHKYFTWDYANIFAPGKEELAPKFLSRFSKWLGIQKEFTARGGFQKLSSLPLSETIENYREVASALRGTPFRYCLEDEPIHPTAGERHGWRGWLSKNLPLFQRRGPDFKP